MIPGLGRFLGRGHGNTLQYSYWENSMDRGAWQALRILEWVAISFSRGSSQLRDQTRVSCIAGGFFTTELPEKPNYIIYVTTEMNLKIIMLSGIRWTERAYTV